MKPTGLLCCLLIAGGPACSKGTANGSPSASGPAAGFTAPSASAAPAASATTRAPAVIAAWQGSYDSVPATLTLPKNVAWRVPEDSSGVGRGKISLTVDPTTGSAVGTIDGPLGPATLRGLLAAGRLTATIVHSDAGDQGYLGTLAGDASSASIRGTMSVSLAEASALRSATFQLAPAGAAPAAP